jgi:hypothetical protein
MSFIRCREDCSPRVNNLSFSAVTECVNDLRQFSTQICTKFLLMRIRVIWEYAGGSY